MKNILAAFFLLIALASINIQARPQVALVLSGGGARGFAHIGVIEALEAHHVPIDIIIGTSMGSVIGGLYASGIPIQTIKEQCLAQKWSELIENSHHRKYKYYRRKKDDEIFIIKRTFGYSDGEITLPYGIFQGQPLYQFFNTFVLSTAHSGDFDQMPIRYRAIATDLITGKAVVLEKGDLSRCMLASMAVPGVFTPIAIDGHLLVDGGVGANLPIEIAKKMGADIVIAVDVTTPLYTQNQIVSVTSVAQQLTTILTANNVEKSKEALRAQDILIVPELADIQTPDFHKIHLSIERGKQATATSLQEHTFPQVPREIVNFEKKTIEINQVNINANHHLNKKTLAYYLDIQNQKLSQEDLAQRMDYLYGLDIFENIFYSLDEKDNHILNVEPLVDRWGPTYLQGSLMATTDLSGNSSYTVTLGTTRLLLNNLMGEWRALAKLGEQTGLFVELFQPFTANLKWFVNPSLSYERVPLPFFQNRQHIATLLKNEFDAEIAAGRILGNWGEAKVGIANEVGSFRNIIGPEPIPEEHFHLDKIFLALNVDTLDNNYFPRSGVKGRASYTTFNHFFHPGLQFDQLSLKMLMAFAKDRHAASLSANYNQTTSGSPGLENKFFLGGPFQLSGFLHQTLFGDNAFLANIIYYYRAKEFGLNPELSIPIYVGASLETGKVWQEINYDNSLDLLGGGSLFLGSDTPIGPLYLVFGATTTGNKAIHLMVNRVF